MNCTYMFVYGDRDGTQRVANLWIKCSRCWMRIDSQTISPNVSSEHQRWNY